MPASDTAAIGIEEVGVAADLDLDQLVRVRALRNLASRCLDLPAGHVERLARICHAVPDAVPLVLVSHGWLLPGGAARVWPPR
jgi:hypothetical protein